MAASGHELTVLTRHPGTPDVAYDETANRWLVVYENVFSGNDHDIYTKALSVDGTAFLAAGYADFTASDWRGPHCANNKLGQNWLVVAVNLSETEAQLDYGGEVLLSTGSSDAGRLAPWQGAVLAT